MSVGFFCYLLEVENVSYVFDGVEVVMVMNLFFEVEFDFGVLLFERWFEVVVCDRDGVMIVCDVIIVNLLVGFFVVGIDDFSKIVDGDI